MTDEPAETLALRVEVRGTLEVSVLPGFSDDEVWEAVMETLPLRFDVDDIDYENRWQVIRGA